MKNKSVPSTQPQYTIRKHISFWCVTFNGQKACFDHEQGAYYVAYLLLNPPSEPIHAMELEVKSMAHFGQFRELSCVTEIIHPQTGRMVTLEAEAILEQRNLALDNNEGRRYLTRKQMELEAILEDENTSEPVKAEVSRELEELYAYLKANPVRTSTTVSKAVRAVREAIRHFHQNLARAVEPNGNPHPLLRPFAGHLQDHLLTPTARYSQAGLGRTKTGVAGCFTYEAPTGVIWRA